MYLQCSHGFWGQYFSGWCFTHQYKNTTQFYFYAALLSSQNTKSQNIGKYEDTITLINNKINTILPPGKKIIPVISFSVKRTGLYLCHPNIRFQCPSGYNVTFKISESTNTEYELGAYEDSFVISPCGYCSSGYGKPKVLEVGKTYYILAQTTYTEAITLEYMSATVILIKEYL